MSVNEILSQGASYLVSQDIYEDYIQGKDVTLGRPTGSDTVVWVSPNDSINEVLIKSNGDPRIMEELLGLDEFSLGDNPVRIDIDNTNGLDIRIPDASTPGANPNYVPGGSTSGGIPERVIYNCPNPDVYSDIGRIGNTDSINGIPTEQLSFLYRELGSDSTALDNVLSTVHAAGIDNTNANFLDNVIVGLDADGKITNIDVSGTGSLDDIPNSLTATDFRKAKEIPDDMMRAIYPDFDSKTPLEKIGLKGHTSNYDEIADLVKNVSVSDSELSEFAAKIGKNVDNLDDVDINNIKFGKALSGADDIIPDSFVKNVDKFSAFNKFAKAAPVIGTAFTILQFGIVGINVKATYEDEGYDAAVIVARDGLLRIGADFVVDAAIGAVTVAFWPAGVALIAIELLSGGAISEFVGDLAIAVVDLISGRVIPGSDLSETLYGNSSDNIIFGAGGDDEIYGYGGDDILYGEDGNDKLYGGDGDDILYGDADYDYYFNLSDGEETYIGNDELHGGNGNDSLFGDGGDDILYGDAGDDYLEDLTGDNHLYGGDGDDTLVSGEGTDYMYGDDGNDYFIGGDGENYMYGGSGADRMQGGEGYDYMEGGTGDDVLSGGNGYNEMYGQEGNDEIYGGNDNDYIDGGVGDDQLYGGNGENKIYGQDGNDIIYDGDDGSYIYGGTGNDSIYAGGGNDVIDGGEGDDYIQDDHGDDTIIFKAGYGTDTISDAAGNNTIQLSGLSIEDSVMSRINWSGLKISFGADNIIIKQYFDGGAFQNFNINGTMLNDLITTLHGSDNDDWMSAWNDNGVSMNGGNGNDTIQGGNGNDTLDGGTGNDFLNGNGGNDTYIFSKGFGNDTVEDWSGSSVVKLTDINIDEISISKSNDSTLILTIDSTGDTLTVNGYKWSQDGYTFEFADGTTDTVNKDTWKWESGFGGTEGEGAQSEQNIINGTVGSDNLYGSDSNDILDGGTGNDILNGGNGMDTYIFGKGYGCDTVNEWGNDRSVIKLNDVKSDEVTVSDQWGSNLILSINGTEDTLTISNFKWGQASFTFEFADGAVATVNKDTWALEFSQLPTIITEEETAIQTNADLLSGIYEDETVSSALFSETDVNLLADTANASAILSSDESDLISEQTDVQTIVLIDAMAGFVTESNISDTNNFANATDDIVTNQLLVGTQVQ